MRAVLIKQGVGPDADPASAIPPKPSAPPRDYWLEDILDGNAPAPKEDDGEPEEPEAPVPAATREPAMKTPKAPKVSAEKPRKKRPKKPKAGAPRTAWDTRPQSPRQSLLDAYDAVPYRLRWLAYHLTAAYMGWSMGLADYATHVTAWIADTGFGPQAWFWCAVGAATLLLHRRTRGLWWPIAWCAAVPAASTVVGVLLYAPTQ